MHAVVYGKRRRAPVSVFRRHPKIDDRTLIRLVYYFCCGVGIDAVAGTLGVSRKTVREHYLELRARLLKPKFRRWHHAYSALPTVSDPGLENRLRGAFFEALVVCHFSECHANYEKGNRKNRVCRGCPLSSAFTSKQNVIAAVGVIDDIRAFYRRVGIRGRTVGDKSDEFFVRFIHAGTIACVRESSRRLPNGLLDPAEREFQAVGTLVAMLMDDLADDHVPRFLELP